MAVGVAYTNCGQNGEIALKSVPVESTNAVTSTPTTPEVPVTIPTDPVQQILSSCQMAQNTHKLMVSSQIVTFDDTRVETQKEKICEFAMTSGYETILGNLSMNNGYLQARYEQNRKLNLPAGAVICDIQMKNDLQKFMYDDVFFFTFNGYLLASNLKSSVVRRLTAESKKLSENNFTDIYTYDWMKIRTARFENVADDYCAGAEEGLGQCSWPVTQQQGNINFSFAPSLLISMSAGRSSDNQNFSFIITGDNDPLVDCYHEKLEFAMTVKYYLPSVLSGTTP